MRGGIKGVTYPGQYMKLSARYPELFNPDYPYEISTSEGCNSMGTRIAVTADGSLVTADGSLLVLPIQWSTEVACYAKDGAEAFRWVVRDGMTVYTSGNRVFLKNGSYVLEFTSSQESTRL